MRTGPSCLLCFFVLSLPVRADNPTAIAYATQRVVKLYGAGGVGRIEAYGSGLVVSAEGHILTVLSPILDASELKVVLADGRRRIGRIVDVDASRELAVVKIEADELPYFDLRADRTAEPGDLVLAFGNMFNVATGDEPVSVQRGVVAAFTSLRARQGLHRVTLPGKLYILDASTNNPGSAGGAVTDTQGRLLGMIGKEVRNSRTETWVNYAIPVSQLRGFVLSVVEGKQQPLANPQAEAIEKWLRPDAVDLRGILPLPEVIDHTPAFIDGVEPGSPAEKAGLLPDDLILFVENTLIQSLQELRSQFEQRAKDHKIRLIVLRDEELLSIELETSKKIRNPKLEIRNKSEYRNPKSETERS